MLSFPANCTTPADRTEYAYRAQELLRLLHNVMGTWYREGISESLWNKLPLKVRNRFPYGDRLSKDEWRDFLVVTYDLASSKVIATILEARNLLKQSTRWEIDIGAVL